MSKERAEKKRYNFIIDSETYNDFSLLCDELGLVRSKNLERYMKKFIEENKESIVRLKKGGNK